MATTTAGKFSMKPRSHVWKYFTRSSGVDGRPLCICNQCNKVYRFSRDCTSNLARHLRLGHKIILARSVRKESSTMAPNSPTFKYRANEMPDNGPDTLILECTDSDETSENSVSVTQFFEKTDVSVAGSSACILCGCVFGPAEQNPDNLLAHLNMKHEDDVPSDLWPLLKASAKRDSGQESSKAATQVDASTPAIMKRHRNKAHHPSYSSRGISHKPRSLVWRFFDRPVDDSSIVRCRLCKKAMSRGHWGSTTTYLKHLYMLHADTLIAEGLDPATLPAGITSAADKLQSKYSGRAAASMKHGFSARCQSPRTAGGLSNSSSPSFAAADGQRRTSSRTTAPRRSEHNGCPPDIDSETDGDVEDLDDPEWTMAKEDCPSSNRPLPSKLRDENEVRHGAAPIKSSPRQTDKASKSSGPDEENHEAISDETLDDEELDHFPADKNNSISAVERLWSRHCAEQEKEYQAELLALDLQAAEFQGRLSELQRLLAGVKEQRTEAEARRRKELLRQHQLKKQFVLATAALKNQDPICDTQGGEAMQKRKSGNDSIMADVIKRHRQRPASLTCGRLPGDTQCTDASLITERPSGNTRHADAKGTRNGCGTGRDVATSSDSSDETDKVKLCELTGQIV